MNEATNKALDIFAEISNTLAKTSGTGGERAVAVISALSAHSGLMDRLKTFDLKWEMVDTELVPDISLDFYPSKKEETANPNMSIRRTYASTIPNYF